MWRKTRSSNAGTSCMGTDPNRNFDAGWCSTSKALRLSTFFLFPIAKDWTSTVNLLPAAIGASSNPCSDTYCGASPESEIEAKNVANFIRKNKASIKAYITVHSYSQLLLFPYSYQYGLAAHHSELVSGANETLLDPKLS